MSKSKAEALKYEKALKEHVAEIKSAVNGVLPATMETIIEDAFKKAWDIQQRKINKLRKQIKNSLKENRNGYDDQS